MGFWSRMFWGHHSGNEITIGGVDRSDAHGTKAPLDFQVPIPDHSTQIEAIPGELRLRFHAHGLDYAPGAYLTAVTEGLARHDQREIALTMKVTATEHLRLYMSEMTSLFTQVHGQARMHRLVCDGGFTKFQGRGPFGRDDNGLVYVEARPIPGVDLPDGALAAVLLDAAEIRVVVACGPYRILSRIGRQCGVFPFPCWSDLARATVAKAGLEGESLLAKVARARIPGVAFVAQLDRLQILISPHAHPDLLRVIHDLSGAQPQPRAQALALLTDPAPDADARLVWAPGQHRPKAITPPGTIGSRVTGSFIVLVPASERDEVRLIEDGYAVLLTVESWESLRAALRGRQPLALLPSEGPSLLVEWPSREWLDAVEIRRRPSTRGWHQANGDRPSSGSRGHEPAGGATGDGVPSAEKEGQAAISPHELAEYKRAISLELAEIPRSVRLQRHTLYFQCVLEPAVAPRFTARCLPLGHLSSDVLSRIASLEAPRVRDRIVFQVVVERGSDA